MTKPDWQILEDYDYCKELDGTGFAWEFLRRSKVYRDAHAQLSPSDFIDPDKDPNLPNYLYSPAQAVRISSEGGSHAFSNLTRAKIIAHKKFRLNDMHAPDTRYDPSIIKFDVVSPLPLFIGNGVDYKTEDRNGEIAVTISATNDDGCPLISEIERYSKETGIVFAIFDTSVSISHQIDQAKAVLEKAANHKPWGKRKAHVKRDDLMTYLRVLDYLDDTMGIDSKGAVVIIGKGKLISSGKGLKQSISDISVTEAQGRLSEWKMKALEYCTKPHAFITGYSIQNS